MLWKIGGNLPDGSPHLFGVFTMFGFGVKPTTLKTLRVSIITTQNHFTDVTHSFGESHSADFEQSLVQQFKAAMRHEIRRCAEGSSLVQITQ